MSTSAIDQWCRWASQVSADAIPAEARKHAFWAMCNWHALVIQAAADPLIQQLRKQMRQHPHDQASAVGGQQGDPAWAAWVNAAAAHVEDFDDTHYATIIHPTAPVYAALAAVAEARDLRGSDMERGFVTGVDLALRLGLAVYPSHYDRGFHITATTGVIAGAVGIGCMLGYDADALQQIIAIASCQPAGSKGAFGSMCKAWQVGKAAHDAVLAVECFEAGMSSGDNGIGEQLGFQALYADAFDADQLIEDLGAHYLICDNAIKPFACGVVAHAAIDAATRIHAAGIGAQDIADLCLFVHPRVRELTGKTDPHTGLEGKFSVYHGVAAAICSGHAGPRQFSDACVNDPALRALRNRMALVVDAALPLDAACIDVNLIDGSATTYAIAHAVSSIENPMTDHLLDRKWDDLLYGAELTATALRQQVRKLLAADATRSCFSRLYQQYRHAMTTRE